MRDIKRLLQFIQGDTAEAMEYLAKENLELVCRLCECIAEQATEIKQLIEKQEGGE